MAEVVAIDGPAASGKSTVARRVAAALGFLYVDSGAMYRGVTWKALSAKVAPGDAVALDRMLSRAVMDIYVAGGAVRFKLDGVDPLEELRSAEVTHNVSLTAAVPEVRRRVVAWLRGAVRLGNLVVEGRDIGTAVFPETPFKFYLDAAPEERARRRHAEIKGPETAAKVTDVERSLRRRDAIDSGRQMDPLRVAPGATVIDSTRMSAEEAAKFIVERV